MAEHAARHGWRGIETDLRATLGDEAPGSRMPTEPELMLRYGASRYAVRRALANLQREGLVRVEQGRGAFVHDGYLVSYRLGDRARFTDVLLDEDMTPGHAVLDIRVTSAVEPTAAALGIAPGDDVLTLVALGYANGEVVKHDVSHFPLPRFAALADTLRTARSVTSAVAALGVTDYRRRSTSIIGRLPTPAEARLLRQLPAHPVFETVRLDVDLAGQPIIYGTTVFSCERVRLVLGRNG